MSSYIFSADSYRRLMCALMACMTISSMPLGIARYKRTRDDRHLIDVLHDDLERGFALKRQLAGQHFVHHLTPSEYRSGAVVDFAALACSGEI